jgi:hypothetical protein
MEEAEYEGSRFLKDRYLSTKVHGITSQKTRMLKIHICILLVQVHTHTGLHPTSTIPDLPKQAGS